MISITAIIKSKEETTEVVKKMIHNLVTNTRKEAACIRYDLHYSENVFIIWEEWIDQPGLDIHNSQQYLIDFIAESEDLLAAPIQVYKTTQVL
ncbi:MAG: antibiotic biosynthesis monooxygenase [Flavobacteriales bacterium 32-34-25]|nr:MAG: antibiotic biosynthesis monooxygenase [Flavobacteriales bacterium 32-34-25]